MARYNPKVVEPKWQKIWDETGVYSANLTSTRPKYIAMSMFNYPSGAGIHIGHAMNYTISDVKARYMRQQGYESYHPVGWDAFGLPAENFALKSGISPQESMANIIPMYHKQYRAMGWSNDWEKEIATHLPEYYRWTQWIFSQMHTAGLVYQDSRLQWWCVIDKTVLANEQVIDGKCWRHDGPNDPPAIKKEIKQWFFKITDYAEDLLQSIDELDWTDSVKLAQRNWIGKSIGADIKFNLVGHSEKLEVFTTAYDTIYGVTFMVLAPEHELVSKITTTKRQAEVKRYVSEAERKSEVDRQAAKVKSGVFTGAMAINPINGEAIPIWVADYVLAGYGTGAIMAVPGEDERDYEFAKKYELKVIFTTKQQSFVRYEDIKARPNKYVLANSAEFDGLSFNLGRPKILAKLVKLGVGREKVNYRMLDWSVSRQRYWGAPIPIIHCPKCGPVLVPDKDLPVILPELSDFSPTGDGRGALARATDWLKVNCPKCGGPGERETDTLDTYVDSSWYMYRYFDPHNQAQAFDPKLVKKWEPIDFYNGADHATAHLLYARFIGHFFKKLGLVSQAEPFKQFLYNGKVTAKDGANFSKSKGNGVDPLDIVDQGYGADALRTYLMFAAPLDQWVRWDPRGVPGTFRFLSRVWNLVTEYLQQPAGQLEPKTEAAINRCVHAMIKKMTLDLDKNLYNTAISAAMTCTNELYKLKNEHLVKQATWQTGLDSLVACIAPFAPHLSDELWQQLGHSLSVQRDSWPKHDDKYLAKDHLTIVVQINGKVRAQVEVAAEASETAVIAAAQANPKVKQHLKEQPLKKTIYVPGKLVNFVV